MSSWKKILVLSLVLIFGAPQLAHAQNVAPTVSFCLGGCPTLPATSPTSAAPSQTVSSAPSGAQTSPSTSTAPSTAPIASPSVAPCPTTSSASVSTLAAKKKKGKSRPPMKSGFLQQFILLILQFLQQLFKLLGVSLPNIPGTGCPTTAPSPVPSGSGGGGGGGSVPSTQPQPSSSPSTGAIQPTSAAGQPTGAPVTVSSCTTPKYTIQMDPNNAQNGVTIGNYYLTADTWNAANYQLSQTVYACDFNNWYVVANMNNNSGDGAVKTSPNVHEDINKPLSSFKTISSTFAESGPHVGIYEYEYDLWLNGFDNGSTEVMIWVDNFGQTPSGSKQGTFTDGGHTYDVYSDGSGYVAFVAQSNFTSGTINILDFFNYVTSKGWAATSSTVSQLDFGMELVSTNNAPATFKVTNFSITTN
jgi:glycosyl hydrolase family 12